MFDDLDRLRHDGAVPAMVADEDRHARRFGGLAQSDAAFERIRERLLHERRHTPAATHASACWTWSWFGVASTTPSGRATVSNSPSDPKNGTPSVRAKSTAAGAGSTIADSVQYGVAAMIAAWRRPIIPAPATAMPTAVFVMRSRMPSWSGKRYAASAA
jgi:hypothetical protein